MRWPFRRKAAERTAAASMERDRPQGSVAPDEASVTRAPARQWATLPAIPTVIPVKAPLVVGPAPVVPPLRLDDRRGAASVESPVGTVTGLAQPVVRATEPVTPTQHADVPPPHMTRRVVRSVPANVAPLVDAVDEYVGEPREPAEPYRAPGWLRFMPDWAKSGQQPAIPGVPAPTPDLPAPAGPDMVIAEPPSFLPPELRNPPRTELPPRMAEGVQPAAETVAPPARRRRPSLGQSRRLGLGAPIPKPDLVHPEEPPPIVDGTVESPQEPPPPSAAPARDAAEPGPEPTPEQERAAEPTPAAREIQEQPAEAPPASADTPPAPTRPPASAPRVPPAAEQQSTASPVPLTKPVAATYRATAELRPAPRRELPRATVVNRVPAALANEVRTRQQADVSEVPVYRGPKVDEAAKARGARAFASGGAVFLPDEAGPVDSPRARGLLAHELVHAVQQRTLGPRLPAPDSPLGQRLEAEAQAAERFYAGEAGATEPPPLIHAPAPAPAAVPEPDLTMAAQLATEIAAATTQTPAPTQQALQSPFDAPTTAAVDRIATESARHVVQEWTNPALQQQHGAATGQTAGGAPSASGTHASGSGHGGGTPSAGGTRSGGTQSSFNAVAFREQLVAAALARHNAALSPGQAPVGELSQEELDVIDRQVETEAQRHGVTVQSNQPPAQHYEANSAQAWMHAITGMNMNYGSGWGGWRDSVPVGSAQSWYGSETGDTRPRAERLADQLGFINADTDNSFDEWFQPEPDAKKDDKAGGAAGQSGSGANQPATHEDNIFGRPNPDRSGVDINKIDLDELATRLYDRLRSRLRLELLVDRERAGMLTDFR